LSLSADDPQGQARLKGFVLGLQQLGWIDGRNLRIDIRWSAGDADRSRRYAAELFALAPDVLVASGGSVVGSLIKVTSTVPIVFTLTPDPVGAGFVASLARPGGNATGFTQVEYGMSAKFLELLKEIAPRVMRAAVLRDPTIPQGIGQFAVIQSVAPSLKIEVTPIDIRDAGELERAVTTFAHPSNGGLVVPGSGTDHHACAPT
jgi:putative tryptophan/tyrosine transport system substrate-binding protein